MFYKDENYFLLRIVNENFVSLNWFHKSLQNNVLFNMEISSLKYTANKNMKDYKIFVCFSV